MVKVHELGLNTELYLVPSGNIRRLWAKHSPPFSLSTYKITRANVSKTFLLEDIETTVGEVRVAVVGL